MAERRAEGSLLPGAGMAAAAVAVLCCAGLPAISAAIGGLTLVALLGAGAGLLAAVALLAITLVLIRSRRARDSPR